MGAPKGNKYAKGGKRPGAGRPTKEQSLAKLTFAQELARERALRAHRLAVKYFDMAEADPATMRHAVDRVEAAAKQEFLHQIENGIDRELLQAIMGSKESRTLAEQVTKSLASGIRTTPIVLGTTNGHTNGNGNR